MRSFQCVQEISHIELISWTPWKLGAFSGSVQVAHSLFSCSIYCTITISTILYKTMMCYRSIKKVIVGTLMTLLCAMVARIYPFLTVKWLMAENVDSLFQIIGYVSDVSLFLHQAYDGTTAIKPELNAVQLKLQIVS